MFIFAPDKASSAFMGSISIFFRISIALGLVFFLILLFNLFLRPAHLIRLLGEKSGIKGVIISAIAGIVSVGPIYAWYPLLKELKERGARNSLIEIGRAHV